MRYRALGTSGLQVSAVGLGCNNFGGRIDEAASKSVLDAALDAGITLLDTADIYSDGESERIIGAALSHRRDDFVLATKWGHARHDAGYGPAAGAKGGRAYIRRAVEASLRRLRTDHIDLYQLHTPDPVTPVEETLAALTELVNEGKVRYVGSSQFDGWRIAEAEHVARAGGYARFVSAQNQWSLLDREVEAEVVPAARHYGLGVLPFFPLANGLLTGKVRRGRDIPAGSRIAERTHLITEKRLDQVEALAEWARKRDRTTLEAAIAGLAAQPGCSSVIAGATSPEQVRANAAAGDWELTGDELTEVDALTSG